MSRFKGRALQLSALISAGLGLLASCEVAPENVAGPSAERAVPPEPAAMAGFSWVVDKQVAGLPRPGSKRPLDQDLRFLRDQGVDVLVTLTEKPLDAQALSQHGIESLHIPVPDYHAPTQEQLDQYVGAVKGWTSEGRQVGTHCFAGLGRTGTFFGALFVARGMDADAAIAEVRRLRPGSIETAAQEQAIRDFAARHE
jgi:atypical dual specificity phosphatase